MAQVAAERSHANAKDSCSEPTAMRAAQRSHIFRFAVVNLKIGDNVPQTSRLLVSYFALRRCGPCGFLSDVRHWLWAAVQLLHTNWGSAPGLSLWPTFYLKKPSSRAEPLSFSIVQERRGYATASHRTASRDHAST